METLNKIDFAVVFAVQGANPNGDPLNGNRPRINYDGMGEMSDVCIKRKIRNRLMEAGENIFVQSADNRKAGDDYTSLHNRQEGELGKNLDEKTLREKACAKWIDVRAFGQLFAYKAKGGKNKKAKGEEDSATEAGSDAVSVGIRGPVSIHPAFSVLPVGVSSIQITKSVSGEGDGKKRASDTMGMKHRVDHGVYVFYGAINPQLAEKTKFNNEDALKIKSALEHLFDNDASSARPEGSMEVLSVVWWDHKGKNAKHNSAEVHRSLTAVPTTDTPKTIKDYKIQLKSFKDLVPEKFDPYSLIVVG